MRWKPRGEWELIRSDPTPLSPTLRPAIPTWAERPCPLPPKDGLQPPLRRSELAWKELSLGAAQERQGLVAAP